jgi:hypothetical protein
MESTIKHIAELKVDELKELAPDTDPVQLLAEAIEATSLGEAALQLIEEQQQLPRLKQELHYLNARLQALEKYAAETPMPPDHVDDDDESLWRFRTHLARARDLGTAPHNKWDTPSERKKRARQLLTLRATAEKLDVQRQAHWDKVHEVFAKIVALEEICDEDGEEAQEAAAKEEEEHQHRLEDQRAIEKIRAAAAKRLAASRQAKKRRRERSPSVSSSGSSSTVAMEHEDVFAAY